MTAPTKAEEGGKLARVVARGEQENKVFVVVLSADENGREKDLRSFGVEGGGRYDPVREKAERFAERVNAAFFARVKPLVGIVEELARTLTCHCQWNALLSDADFHRPSCRIGRAKKILEAFHAGK